MSSHKKKNPAVFLCDNPLVKLPKYMGDTPGFEEINRVRHEDFIILPCGKCDHCLEKKSKEWGHRMLLESKCWDKMAFVTLTFDDEKSDIKQKPDLEKSEIQRFLKRLRKRLNGRKIKYFVAGEYGPKNFRKHYHIILFGVDGADTYSNISRLKQGLQVTGSGTDWHAVYDSWEHGFIDCERPLSGGCFHYLSGYVAKISKRKDEIEAAGLKPEFRLMSKGLGKRYIENYARQIKQKKKKRPQLPMQYFEYRYKDKKSGKTKIIKRGLGRYLKSLLHETIGMESILKMWNKFHQEITTLTYAEAGVTMIVENYLKETLDEREYVNLLRLAKEQGR